MESSCGNIREVDIVPKANSKATGMPWKAVTVPGEAGQKAAPADPLGPPQGRRGGEEVQEVRHFSTHFKEEALKAIVCGVSHLPKVDTSYTEGHQITAS